MVDGRAVGKKSKLSELFKVPENPSQSPQPVHESTVPEPVARTSSRTAFPPPSPRPNTLNAPPGDLSATQKLIWQDQDQIKELEGFLVSNPV